MGIFASMYNDELYEREQLETEILRKKHIEWIINSQVGATVEYWYGFLAEDRDPSRRGSRRANVIGSLFWAAASIPKTPNPELGSTWGVGLNLLQLSQKKLDHCKYTYSAKKISELPDSIRSMYQKTLLNV